MLSKTFLFQCAFFGSLLAAPAAAQSLVYDQIEEMHGDADGFNEAFQIVTQAFTYGDPVTIAEWPAYPLRDYARNEEYELFSESDLLENFDYR